MAKQKQEYKQLTTPKGITKYCFLNQPQTNFNEDGVYSTQLLLDPKDPEVKKFHGELKALAAQAVAEAKKKLGNKPQKIKSLNINPFFEMEHDEGGNKTGMAAFKFSMNALVKGKARKPSLFDAQNNKIDPEVVSIGSGSTVRIGCNASVYYMANGNACGVKLYLQAVKVLDLKQYEGGGAGFFGFEEEEDGYTFDGEAMPEEETATSTTVEADDDDEFGDVEEVEEPEEEAEAADELEAEEEAELEEAEAELEEGEEPEYDEAYFLKAKREELEEWNTEQELGIRCGAAKYKDIKALRLEVIERLGLNEAEEAEEAPEVDDDDELPFD